MLAQNCLIKDPEKRLGLVTWESFTASAPSVSVATIRDRVKRRKASITSAAPEELLSAKRKLLLNDFQGRTSTMIRGECISNADVFPPVEVNDYPVPDADAVTHVVDLFARLKKAHETPRLSAAIRASALLLELFSFFLELPDGSSDLMGHRALARAQNLLQSRGGDDLSFGDLAKKAGVSEGYLRSLFRQRLGSSPVKYRNTLRLMRARDMLLSTDMSVKEAAASVGFQDQLYFSRIFRGHFGISPRELIRKHRLPVFGAQ